MPSSHWGGRTQSVVAPPEAAAVWSELPEENPGCSSGIARQPEEDTRSSISSGLRVRVDVCEDKKRRVSGQKPLGTTAC